MKTTFTKKEDNYIIDNYLKIPIKRIAKNIGRSGYGVSHRMKKLNLVVPKDLAAKRKKESMYRKGQTPHNKGKKQVEFMSAEAIEKTKKTRFKKGRQPHNTKFNGYEKICSDGYVYLRVSKGIFKLKHVYNWEAIHGKIPKSHCLKCIDGNKQNTDPTNWRLISRAENMYRNSKLNYPENLIPSLVLVNEINNTINNIKNGTK